MTVRELVVNLVFRGDEKSAKKAEGAIESLKGKAEQASSSFNVLAKVVAAGFAAKKIIDVSKNAYLSAQALEDWSDSLSRVFGSATDAMDEWSKNALNDFGISEVAAKQMLTRTGATLNSLNIQGDVSEMSKTLTGLAADYASFYMMSTEDAYAKLQNALMGNAEGLKSLGKNFTQAELDATAMASGLGNSYKALSAAQQAQVRYNHILKISSQEMGDFARNADVSFSNMAVIIKNNLSSALTNTFKGAIPYVTELARHVKKATSEINNFVNSNQERLGAFFNKLAHKFWSFVIDVELAILRIMKKTGNLKGLRTLLSALGKVGALAFKVILKSVEMLAPVLDYALGVVGDIINFLMKFEPVLMKVLPPILAIAGGLFLAWKAYQKIVAIKMLWAKATKIVSVAQTVLNAAMSANPIGLIIAAVGLLIAGLYKFFTATETGRKAWKKFTETLKTAWGSIVGGAKAAWNGIKEIFSAAGTALGDAHDFISSVVKNIITIITGAFKGVGGFFKRVVEKIKEPFKSIKEFFTGIWDGILDGFNKIFEPIKEGLKKIGGVFSFGKDDKGTSREVLNKVTSPGAASNYANTINNNRNNQAATANVVVNVPAGTDAKDAKGFGETVKNAVKGALSDLLNIGKGSVRKAEAY